jgi:hypothetical protein
MKSIQLFALTAILSTGIAMAQAPAVTPAKPATATKTAKPAPTPPPSASDIAAAKTKNMVWANLNTKVYHYAKDKEYGTTKNGKFMTEADAKAANYKAAKS